MAGGAEDMTADGRDARGQTARRLRASLELIARFGAPACDRVRLPVGAGMGLRERARVAPAASRELLEALAAEVERCEQERGQARVAAARRCLALLARVPGPGAAAYRTTAPERLEEGFGRLASSLRFVRGIGPRRAEALARFGLETVEDLLHHLPFRYEERRIRPVRDLRPGETATVCGELLVLSRRRVGRAGRTIVEGVLRDDTGLLRLVWYRGETFIPRAYPPGRRYRVHGRVEAAPDGARRMAHPQVEPGEARTGRRVVPVYRKPAALSGRLMRRLVTAALRGFLRDVPAVMPAPVAVRAGTMEPARALRRLHLPGAQADPAALTAGLTAAHRALVVEELFAFQVALLLRRRELAGEPGTAMPPTGELATALRRGLPFRLTAAQEQAVAEILQDMAAPRPMRRLLQGDVGCGKTVVALLAVATALENRRQAVVLAPTRILAEQHFETFRQALAPLGVRVACCATGRRDAGGDGDSEAVPEADVVVGTHAVLDGAARLARLGLVVIDEQHRFGVRHRAALALGRGVRPDLLLMSATPIPRSLALALYGDLDLTVIAGTPAGRGKVRTHVLEAAARRRAYGMLLGALAEGRQAYVVFPRIGGDGEEEVRGLVTMARELASTVFRHYPTGVVHGRMPAAEVDATLRAFRAGQIRVLLGTTVLEVGIDVPGAGAMLVEEAERFGLAQLHQLRGRVGRDGRGGECILVLSSGAGERARRRLAWMESCADGWRVARQDLRARGPGDMLGTRQSGMPALRAIALLRDPRWAVEARRLARWWLREDPDLARPESAALRRAVLHRWGPLLDLASVG